MSLSFTYPKDSTSCKEITDFAVITRQNKERTYHCLKPNMRYSVRIIAMEWKYRRFLRKFDITTAKLEVRKITEPVSSKIIQAPKLIKVTTKPTTTVTKLTSQTTRKIKVVTTFSTTEKPTRINSNITTYTPSTTVKRKYINGLIEPKITKTKVNLKQKAIIRKPFARKIIKEPISVITYPLNNKVEVDQQFPKQLSNENIRDLIIFFSVVILAILLLVGVIIYLVRQDKRGDPPEYGEVALVRPPYRAPSYTSLGEYSKSDPYFNGTVYEEHLVPPDGRLAYVAGAVMATYV